MSKRTGGCLCGAVRLQMTVPDLTFLACHCGQCRRWTGGGPHYAISVTDVGIEGAAHIVEHYASEWGARGFCGTCGTTLYWKMRDRDITSVAVGTLDDQDGLRLSEEIFSDCRAPWMAAVAGASQSTEAQEMAKLAAYMERKERE